MSSKEFMHNKTTLPEIKALVNWWWVQITFNHSFSFINIIWWIQLYEVIHDGLYLKIKLSYRLNTNGSPYFSKFWSRLINHTIKVNEEINRLVINKVVIKMNPNIFTM
jgi:hypothetical protein